MGLRNIVAAAMLVEPRTRAKIRKWDRHLLGVPVSTSIPKIIHQTSKSKELVPELAVAVKHAQDLNKGWLYSFYDDAACRSLVEKNYGSEVLNLYDKINPRYGAAKADLFRYLVVYLMGGVYADIKTQFERPFDETLRANDTFIISYWDGNVYGADFGRHAELKNSGGREIQQWFIISARGHPFLRAVLCRVLANIEIYSRFVTGVGRHGVLRTTGPIAYTKAIAPLLNSGNFRRIECDREVGLNYSIGGNYDHQATFPDHYTKQSSPVILH